MTLEYMQDNYDEVNAELHRLNAIQMEENTDAKSTKRVFIATEGRVFIGSGEDADILFPFGLPACASEDCCSP